VSAAAILNRAAQLLAECWSFDRILKRVGLEASGGFDLCDECEGGVVCH